MTPTNKKPSRNARDIIIDLRTTAKNLREESTLYTIASLIDEAADKLIACADLSDLLNVEMNKEATDD